MKFQPEILLRWKLDSLFSVYVCVFLQMCIGKSSSLLDLQSTCCTAMLIASHPAKLTLLWPTLKASRPNACPLFHILMRLGFNSQGGNYTL
jgi:hypothetical protein